MLATQYTVGLNYIEPIYIELSSISKIFWVQYSYNENI